MISRFQNGATFWNRPRNKIVDIVIFVENFESFVGPGFCENQKMVLVNGDQYPKSYLCRDADFPAFFQYREVGTGNEISRESRESREIEKWAKNTIFQ